MSIIWQQIQSLQIMGLLLASRVAEAMVAEMTVHTTANVIELFLHTLVLQTTPFLDVAVRCTIH